MTKQDWEFINELLDVIKIALTNQNEKITKLEKQVKKLSVLKDKK